jgi:Domain of unknown function (DUF4148)
MNTPKMMPLMACAALAAAFATARAAEADTVAAPKTRAEVIAELQIWRESGLAAMQSNDSADYFSRDYLVAQQRYEQMRASPHFAALVERIARERGETLFASRQ